MNVLKLEKEQIGFSKKLLIKDDFTKIDLIAGCDQSIVGDDIYSSIVVLDKDFNVVEKVTFKSKVKLPYIHGFLSYREGPVIIENFAQLTLKPDIMLVDGNGIIHPRSFGLACYVGLALDLPTIGVAKSLHEGELKEGSIYINGKLSGHEFRPKEHANPIYVSPGHRVSIKSSLEIVKSLMKQPHKLPEPLHLAHKFLKDARE